jgi:hypothetical protein
MKLPMGESFNRPRRTRKGEDSAGRANVAQPPPSSGLWAACQWAPDRRSAKNAAATKQRPSRKPLQDALGPLDLDG